MLKGSRRGVVQKIQPLSVHGQVSWDVYFVDEENPEAQVAVARVGLEAVDRTIEPGDRVEVHYVVGAVTRVEKL